jgi:hypothetical protein
MMMKKFTLSVIALMMLANVFAQQVATQGRSERQSNSTKGEFVELNKTRSAVVSEDFETWPPADWTIVDGANSQGTQHWHQSTMDEPYNGVATVLYDDGDAVARPQDEWLITPEFVVPESPFLRFNLYTSVYWFIDPYDNADFNIKITTDDGATWTQLLNEHDIENLENYTWKVVLVNLTDYTGETAKIAFQYVGEDAAQTMIDNVEVFSQPDYDVQLSDVAVNFNFVDDPHYSEGGNYHLSGHFARIPKPVLDEHNTIMLFNAVVFNFGQEDATVNCEVKVLDPDENEVYSQMVTTENPLASGATDTLDIGWADETLFSLESFAIGEYSIVYELSIEGQEDQNASNNTKTVSLEATNGVYSRAPGKQVDDYVGPTIWTGGAAGDEVIVGYDIMFPEAVELGDFAEITSIDLFIHESTTAGHALNANVSFYDTDINEWVVIGGTPLFVIDEGDLNSMINLTFSDPIYVIKNATNFVNLRLSVMVHDDPGNSEYVLFGTEEVPTEGWSTQWVINGSSFGSDPYTISNFTDQVPIFNLNMDFNASVNSENTWNDFMLYPNPAKDILTLENVENANIEVFDMLGSLVKTVKSENNRVKIHLGELAEGTYVIRISGDDGVGVRKFNLIR